MELGGTTRGRILTLVKERGRCHPDVIADELGLATTSVRQHLAALQRDGYVRTVEVREGTGRPRNEFLVTRHGDAAFPKRYDALAATLLRTATNHRGGEIVDLFIEGEVARLKGYVNGFDTRTRMEEVAHAMREDGGMATVRQDNGCTAIVEQNCVYARIASSDPTICEAHAQIVERLLAVPVAFSRTSDPFLGGCCWRAGMREQEGADPQEA